ncbi:MAG: hypothetical protein JW850_23560 [Thermoflexales bacterium]|nr:hypothetical protein [Thermoflexales bacterium]
MEQTTPDELASFVARVTTVLEELGIDYYIVGGYAAIAWGEPRLTIDADIVVNMASTHVKAFVERFPIDQGYYVSQEGIYDALRRRYAFNVIHSFTGARVDLMPVPGRDAATRQAMARRRRIEFGRGYTAYFASPEDILLFKLRYYVQTDSSKHLRDARGILAVQGSDLDMDYISAQAARLGITHALEALQRLVDEQSTDERLNIE